MDEIVDQIVLFIKSSGLIGPILCCILIVIESIIPILPLAVFIALNAVFFGPVIGFIVSWIFTIIGCILSYTLFRNKLKKYFDRKYGNDPKVKKFIKGFNNLNFSQYVILCSIPFAPAFLINIVSGLTGVKFKKFLYAILIGKVSIVVFWGNIGTSFINSFKDPIIILKVSLMLLFAYIISKIVSKKYNIE